MRILVLRGGALGDLILTLPLLREIRTSYPDATMELWGIFPQALLSKPEFVDRVERLDAAQLAPLFVNAPIPPAVRSRLEGFDLAISLLSDPERTIAQNLAQSGARRVIEGTFPIVSGVHAVYQLAAVLDPLELTLHDPIPKLSVRPDLKRASCLAFHPGSGSKSKNWPLKNWLELTDRLDGLFNDFLLIGGEADDELVLEFRSGSRLRRLRSLTNANLSDLSRSLRQCRCFIGHDTGVTHLAAAVGTPTVALFGATDPAVWAPLGEHVAVVRSPEREMESIGVEAVVEAVRRQLHTSDP